MWGYIPVEKAVILSDSEAKKVKVKQIEDCVGVEFKYPSSSGAVFSYWGHNYEELLEDMPYFCTLLRLMLEFQALVVRDKIPAKKVHKEFMKIREYREHIAPDAWGNGYGKPF